MATDDILLLVDQSLWEPVRLNAVAVGRPLE